MLQIYYICVYVLHIALQHIPITKVDNTAQSFSKSQMLRRYAFITLFANTGTCIHVCTVVHLHMYCNSRYYLNINDFT